MKRGASCVCKDNTLVESRATRECGVAELRSLTVYGDTFWQNVNFCLANNIYMIVNIDLWSESGHLTYTEDQWRRRVDGLAYEMLKLDPTATRWRLTIDNEPMRYMSKEKYAWYVNVACDQIKIARAWTQIKIGAGNEEFSLAAKFGMYEYILENCPLIDYIDIHIQAAVIDAGTMRVKDDTLNYWGSVAKGWAKRYNKRLACTECNWCNVATKEGYTDFIKMVRKAEEIGCDSCCIVFIDYSGSKYQWLSFLVDGKARSPYWETFKNDELIKYKEDTVTDRDLKVIPGYMYGDDVGKVQAKLLEVGFDLKIDEVYGPITESAVKKFQELMKMTQNGVVDKNVRGMLTSITVETFYPEVFQNIYLKKDYSVEAINYYLNEFAHPSLKGHGKYFKQAEGESGIPVEWQLANGTQESSYKGGGIGSSPIAQKYFNLYGWGVPSGGITDEGKFGSFAQCILYVPKEIKRLFLNPDNWRYNGDNIFGIEVYYSAAPYNAINKAKYYREICQILDAGIKTPMPAYVEDLLLMLDKRYEKRQ